MKVRHNSESTETTKLQPKSKSKSKSEPKLRSRTLKRCRGVANSGMCKLRQTVSGLYRVARFAAPCLAGIGSTSLLATGLCKPIFNICMALHMSADTIREAQQAAFGTCMLSGGLAVGCYAANKWYGNDGGDEDLVGEANDGGNVSGTSNNGLRANQSELEIPIDSPFTRNVNDDLSSESGSLCTDDEDTRGKSFETLVSDSRHSMNDYCRRVSLAPNKSGSVPDQSEKDAQLHNDDNMEGAQASGGDETSSNNDLSSSDAVKLSCVEVATTPTTSTSSNDVALKRSSVDVRVGDSTTDSADSAAQNSQSRRATRSNTKKSAPFPSS